MAIAMMADSAARQWGYSLSKESGVRSGVLHPILRRMLEDGWGIDGWEAAEEVSDRPPRRYYELTEKGRDELAFGFPRIRLRVTVLLYPKGDGRRRELLAELYVMPRFARPFWVAEQFETALLAAERAEAAREGFLKHAADVTMGAAVFGPAEQADVSERPENPGRTDAFVFGGKNRVGTRRSGESDHGAAEELARKLEKFCAE
ncbi:PadR family transcriptional regulator [Amycolatopsis sp. NPDC049252]|uniref:PadR family transcriptional regulator n=1 Tax=Amycolatopsis sp. NPDC049252 TaxID=3363933 RepID=UPI00371E042F